MCSTSKQASHRVSLSTEHSSSKKTMNEKENQQYFSASAKENLDMKMCHNHSHHGFMQDILC